MITVKISTEQELKRALPILHKLEPSTSSYTPIRNNLPRFIFIHLNPREGNTWTHGRHSQYYDYPLVDISIFYNLEETYPELFI